MNTKEELIEVQGRKTIAWAKLSHQDHDEAPVDYILKPKHNLSEYAKFMNNLDFTYDSGYGSQQLYGEVMFTDGTWLERDEYDGSEGWSLIETPKF